MDGNKFLYYGQEVENACAGFVPKRPRNQFSTNANTGPVWGPRQFRSSKSHKAACLNQNPSDFMDDEDVGCFGIAPQNIQIKGSFGDVLGFTRSKIDHTDQEHIYVRLIWNKNLNLIVKNLLEQAGWINNIQFEEVGGIIITSDIPITQNRAIDDVSRAAVFEKISIRNRINGLGYEGLKRGNCVTGKCKVNLHFETAIAHTKIENITPGQAFMMGIFDEDDEDIYEVEEIKKFDFCPDIPTIERSNCEKNIYITKCVSGFTSQKRICLPSKSYTVSIPPHFKPRKIRFELATEKSYQPCKRLEQRTLSVCIKSNKSNYQKTGKHAIDSLLSPVTSNTTIFEKDDSYSLKRNFTSAQICKPKKRTKMTEIAQTQFLNKTLKLMDDRFISEYDLTFAGGEQQHQPVEKATSNRLIELWTPQSGLCKRFKVSQDSLKRSYEARGTANDSCRETFALQTQPLVQHGAVHKGLYSCNMPSSVNKEAVESKPGGSQERTMMLQEENKRKEETDLFGVVFGK